MQALALAAILRGCTDAERGPDSRMGRLRALVDDVQALNKARAVPSRLSAANPTGKPPATAPPCCCGASSLGNVGFCVRRLHARELCVQGASL
jgi:hypothetical protein